MMDLLEFPAPSHASPSRASHASRVVRRLVRAVACQERAYRRAYPLYEQLEDAEQVRPASATYGPACAVVGALAAGEVVRLLAGLGQPETIGNALLLDLASAVDRRASRVVVARAPEDFTAADDTYDGTHPSASGEVKIAEQFAAALTGLWTSTAPDRASGGGRPG